MFQSEELRSHLETSSTIKTSALIIAEWNLNSAENISQIGNYRYRPTDGAESKYRTIPNTFDINDEGLFYTGATDADVVIDGGLDDLNVPVSFISKKEKEKMLYSLEDCFNRFRPRSGINKARYFSNKFSHYSNQQMAKRPRYYIASKDDKFKYWSSYRTENGQERGIANRLINEKYYIDDAAPFVVYKNPIPVNRIIVKMQTNSSDTDLGPFLKSSGTFEDPFYGENNKTVPINWKIQYLSNNNWIDAISFNENSIRSDGSAVIGSDGYVEIAYEEADGVNYGWQLVNESDDVSSKLVETFVNPTMATSGSAHKEIQYISGIRVVAETMNAADATLDIIEISPRLKANISDRTIDFSLNKNASDLGVSGMPVGQLLASTGSISLFDYDQAFNPENGNSILSSHIYKNIQIKFYDSILDVSGVDYHVPIKTMYADGFPEINNTERVVTISLRDLFFYFESMTAPQLLIQNVSLTQAISILLDSIGFSNYVFYRNNEENDFIIPNFFVGPDISIAKVLQDLAVSTQTAMFFDELNNFVMMTKNYIMPSEEERPTDMVLYGTKDFEIDGVFKNKQNKEILSNIIEISSQENEVYNSGVINYTSRYIQRSYGSIRQAGMVDREKTWIYKPALLWEVSGTQNTKSVNDQVSNQSTYVLGAIPLNSDLTEDLPQVVNNQLINNTIDLGEGVYWITRYNGYFHSNGEVIKYDAVEYSIPGLSLPGGGSNVWITSTQEYQNYFSKLPFNGKIYPTGLVRIYSEPNYEDSYGITKLKNGPVAKHGRGQFGTEVAFHSAGANPYWSSNENVRGCVMKSSYLFGSAVPPTITVGPAGVNNSLASKSTRNSIIRNFLSSSFISEEDSNKLVKASPETGTIQSSALVFNGPSFTTTELPIDFISYVYKPLTNKFKHFGTRVRVIGKIENSESRGQTPIGSTSYYVVSGTSPEQSVNINGGSAGLGILVNPETNNGYYFEIAALTEKNIDKYSNNSEIHNVLFYKIGASGTEAIPVKLWGGLLNIIVDDGKFTGQSRLSGEENPTVYDLSVEYQDLGSTRRFFLYINNKIVATVDDASPLPVYNNMSLFVRGSSRAMFENIYALTNNYSQNTAFAIDTPISSVTGDSEINANESFRKYAMSSVVQSTYLSGISPSETPKYNMYFEEFGSIMREAAYLKVRYDKAYPALYAKISPTFNSVKGYTVSGFQAGAYGAEFLVFNSTDTALSLDESTGNYLRIQGVTFTQESNNELSVDDYFSKNSDFSNPQISSSNEVLSPLRIKQEYQDIKNSRITYGKKEFSISANYIQSQDDAAEMMKWIISKTMKPRKSVGVKVFGSSLIQLGDIVQISYQDQNQISEISPDSRFTVYSIDHSRSSEGPVTNIYLSEVL